MSAASYPAGERVVVGTYRRCPTCLAPWADPIPDDWTLQVRRTPAGRTLLIPHRDDCPPVSGHVWGPSLGQEPVTFDVDLGGRAL